MSCRALKKINALNDDHVQSRELLDAGDVSEFSSSAMMSRRKYVAALASLAAVNLSAGDLSAAYAAQASSAGKKVVLITGASPGGLGYATAEALAAEYGFEVVMSCRTVEKSAEAARTLLESRPALNVRAAEMPLELSDLGTVSAFAKAWKGPLDCLVCNAGIMAAPYGTTKQNHEMHYGVNHLGHFALTNQLLPVLRNGNEPKVVSVSSAASFLGIDVDDLEWQKRKYEKWGAYGASKAANVLFTDSLATREQAAGSPVKAFSCHPGVVNTNLARYILPESMQEKKRQDEVGSQRTGKLFGMRTVEDGARCQTDLAANGGNANGDFYIDFNKPYRGAGMKWRTDSNADKLWQTSVASCEEVGIKI